MTRTQDQGEDKNHRADSKGAWDRVLKGLKQNFLHVLRTLALLHPIYLAAVDPEALQLAQQLWLFVLNVEEDLVKERKRRSIPNSVQQTEHVLFGNEDLKVDSAVSKVNQAGTRSLGMSWERPSPVVPPLLTYQVSREKVPGNTEDSRALDNGTLTETGPTLSWEMAMAASLFPSGAMAALDTADTNQEGKVAMVVPPRAALAAMAVANPRYEGRKRPPSQLQRSPGSYNSCCLTQKGSWGVSPCPSGYCTVCLGGSSMLPLPWWLH